MYIAVMCFCNFCVLELNNYFSLTQAQTWTFWKKQNVSDYNHLQHDSADPRHTLPLTILSFCNFYNNLYVSEHDID